MDKSPELIIRTSKEARVLAVIGVLIFMPMVVLPVTGAAGLVGLCIAAPSTLALVIVALRRMFGFRLVLTRTSVGQTRWSGRMRWIERERIALVARADLGSIIASTEVIFLVDAERLPLLRIPCHSVNRDESNRLIQLLGLPTDGSPQSLISGRKLNKLYPGLVRWDERHPYLAALFMMAAILALVIPYAIMTTPSE
jgi:hypothetical protein